MNRADFLTAAALSAALRTAARAALPAEAFLRLDRGPGLFATDAPLRRPGTPWSEALSDAGFLCEPVGGLLRLTPGPTWLSALAVAWPQPPDAFSASLARFDGPPDPDSLRLFARGAKALFRPDPVDDRPLRQRAAVCLRAGGGGGLYACALLRYLKTSTPKEDAP